MPLKDFINILFGTYKRYNKHSYIEPLLPKSDLELKMLCHIHSSSSDITIHKNEFILDISRFKKKLKEIEITGNKSALKYLNTIKTKGRRFIIQENLLNLYIHKTETTESNIQIWNRAFKEMERIIEEAGFGKIEMSDLTYAGTVYDMLIIFYISNLCFIVGYLNVIEYNCFCSYVINSCKGIFNNKNEYCKSYLIGKGLSNINGNNIKSSAAILSEIPF